MGETENAPRYVIYVDQADSGGWWAELQDARDQTLAAATAPSCMAALSMIVDAVAEDQDGQKGTDLDPR